MDAKTYSVTVRFTVAAESDEHLQTPLGIEAEVESLLTGLDAEVESVTVVETKV